MSPLRKQWKRRVRGQSAAVLTIGAVVLWSMYKSEFDLQALLHSGERFSEFFGRLAPPNWSVTGLVIHSTLETLLIALAGTSLGVLVSLPLGFLAASNVTPLPSSTLVERSGLNVGFPIPPPPLKYNSLNVGARKFLPMLDRRTGFTLLNGPTSNVANSTTKPA